MRYRPMAIHKRDSLESVVDDLAFKLTSAKRKNTEKINHKYSKSFNIQWVQHTQFHELNNSDWNILNNTRIGKAEKWSVHLHLTWSCNRSSCGWSAGWMERQIKNLRSSVAFKRRFNCNVTVYNVVFWLVIVSWMRGRETPSVISSSSRYQ